MVLNVYKTDLGTNLSNPRCPHSCPLPWELSQYNTLRVKKTKNLFRHQIRLKLSSYQIPSSFKYLKWLPKVLGEPSTAKFHHSLTCSFVDLQGESQLKHWNLGVPGSSTLPCLCPQAVGVSRRAYNLEDSKAKRNARSFFTLSRTAFPMLQVHNS